MSLQLSGKEFEEIRNGFKQIDKDNDGSISLLEFKACLTDGKEDEDEAVDKDAVVALDLFVKCCCLD